jgi:hypothetical protein
MLRHVQLCALWCLLHASGALPFIGSKMCTVWLAVSDVIQPHHARARLQLTAVVASHPLRLHVCRRNADVLARILAEDGDDEGGVSAARAVDEGGDGDHELDGVAEDDEPVILTVHHCMNNSAVQHASVTAADAGRTATGPAACATVCCGGAHHTNCSAHESGEDDEEGEAAVENLPFFRVPAEIVAVMEAALLREDAFVADELVAQIVEAGGMDAEEEETAHAALLALVNLGILHVQAAEQHGKRKAKGRVKSRGGAKRKKP